MIQVGQKAPDFKLIDKDKKEITLADFKGKNLIMFFFPMAWTGACTKEMCSVQEDYKAYNDMNTAVVGVSVDSHFALKRFAEDNKIEYPLLSDFNKQAIKSFDIIFPGAFAGVYNGVAQRATFVIDENAVIRYAKFMENIGEVPDMNEIKDALAQLA